MKLFILVGMVLITLIVSLAAGSAAVPVAEVMNSLLGSGSSEHQLIVVEIRLPRVLLAVLVGAGISASGAAIQGLFRNPLADPALIGVSAGAAFFAALFVVVGGSMEGLALIGLTGSAFIGGLIATWLVLFVGIRGGGLSTMLLAGIAINAIALAGVGLISYLSSDTQLRSISFWALGSLNGVSWLSVAIACLIPLVILRLYMLSGSLNIITLGDEEAEHLGVSHGRLRTEIILLVAVAVGTGVALTGVIAFIGLVVPHLVRMMMGSNHEVVLPGSALLGGLLLLIADTVSRSVIAPAELPVGILTALIGGPFFVYLIVREQRDRLAL